MPWSAELLLEAVSLIRGYGQMLLVESSLETMDYIHRALNNAVDNGCAEQLRRMSDEDVAYDLAQFDFELGRKPIEVLIKGVRRWRGNPQEA